MYRFIIERSDKIVHLRGQKYSLAKKQKLQTLQTPIYQIHTKTNMIKNIYFTNKIIPPNAFTSPSKTQVHFN